MARGGAAALAFVLTTFLGGVAAHAQTSANADAAYNGWLKAFLVKSGTKTYFANSLSDRTMAFMWGQAYLITGVEDAYEENRAADRKQLVSDLLATFESKNGADLSWDSWNDDAAWATIALVRGYQISNNQTFLDAAAKAWDMAFKRGWDTTYGGGIWENMNNVPNGGKCGLSNWPFVISGVLIYEGTKNASYLDSSKQIYAWSRAHVFDTTTGRVFEQVGPKGVAGDDNAYNSGLIVNAANSLYKATGVTQYYDDAVLAAKHVLGKYAIMTEDHPANGDFGGDQFFRGLGNLARQNGLWSDYLQWLQKNAAAAWSHRRVDYDVSLNNFTMQTPMANLSAMEAEGSVVVQMVVQTGPFDGDSGNGSGLDMDSGIAAGTVTDAQSSESDGAEAAVADEAGSIMGSGALGDSGVRGAPPIASEDAGSGSADGAVATQAGSGCGCTTLGSQSKQESGGTALLVLVAAQAIVGTRSRRKARK